MDMDELLAASDIVSLHARVTPETRGFIGEHQFRTMKRGAYFMNTARGPMVDYDALYRALVDGHLAGAALETFAMEPPPPDWPLLRLPNVTLTPHIAGCSRESVHRRGRDGGGGYRPLVCGATAVALREPGSASGERLGRPAKASTQRDYLTRYSEVTMTLVTSRHRRRHDRTEGRALRPRWHDPGASFPGVPDRLSASQLGAAGSGSVVARGLRRRAQGAGGGRGQSARHRRHRCQRPGAGRRAGGSRWGAAAPGADLAGPPLRAAVRVAARAGGRGGHHPDQRRADRSVLPGAEVAVAEGARARRLPAHARRAPGQRLSRSTA